MKKMLKDIGSYNSFKSREEYESRINTFKNIINFPWRSDQKEIIDNFLEFKYSKYVIHGIFGAGKTTLLLGMLILGILNNLFKPEDIMFISYNISIKNEIKRKLKKYGIANKIIVRTFDSLIFEICKIAKYPHINLPNFDGKRKFVYEKTFDKDFDFFPSKQPKIIFIDECQDLEKQMLDILFRFYPKSNFVFAGDIFQSIQKEPRESILWHYMMLNPVPSDVFKIYMYNTPRVPQNILTQLQKTLSIYYPEFKNKINNWVSSNTTSNAEIIWKRLTSYTHIFNDLKDYLNEPEHTPENTMILTFSSAITVKGNMGDIARIRQFLKEQGINVNNDHKKQDEKSYFLTTSNSSKGLERDYVIIFLTFPLERAFVHLSDDIVLNLITVALTRAKKEVIMYVPSYEDKYSKMLSIFETCPLPNLSRIRTGKIMNEFSFQDYIDNEHCVTELIRASIIKYDTRISLFSNTKVFNFGKLFTEDIKHNLLPIITDEEKCFVGILIENLITSTWQGYWPFILPIDLSSNPMYLHVINRLKKVEQKFSTFKSNNVFNDTNQFEGIYIYSQYIIALSNKLFVNLSKSLYNNLKIYWSYLKPKTFLIKPKTDETNKLNIQKPVRMPWITGVVDVSINSDKEIELYEIKASRDKDWKDNALIQIICYALMSGKTWSRLHLINPFQNEYVSYYFDTKKILTLRDELLKDVLIYNVNSMMAKMYSIVKTNGLPSLCVDNTLVLDIRNDEKNQVVQVSIINIVSPIKVEFVYKNTISNNKEKTTTMARLEKYMCESSLSIDDLLNEVNNILLNPVNKNKTIWVFNDVTETSKIFSSLIDVDRYKSIKTTYNLENEEKIIDFLKYSKNLDKSYELNLTDSLSRNILSLSFLFFNNTFC
jgi:hypothetical protein